MGGRDDAPDGPEDKTANRSEGMPNPLDEDPGNAFIGGELSTADDDHMLRRLRSRAAEDGVPATAVPLNSVDDEAKKASEADTDDE